MEEKQEVQVIDLQKITKILFKRRKELIKPLAIVFILSCIYIFSIPRYYTTDVRLAPEINNDMAGGALSSIASSFGIDLSDMQTSDAISPLLYPDLMEDNGFAASLFFIPVETADGEIKANYHDYLKDHQKKPWWTPPFEWLSDLFKSSEEQNNKEGEYDPYMISRNEDGLLNQIRDNIVLSIDKKTGVITINVKDQDPCICKALADSVKEHLQLFITNYRTNKARVDVQYYEALADSARIAYKKAVHAYGAYSDANMGVVLQSYRSKIEDLENEVQLKMNTYSVVSNQLQAAKSKVQERTPAFTVIKGAAMPVKPAGPKRMMFVAGMLFLAFFAKAFWMVRSDLHFNY